MTLLEAHRLAQELLGPSAFVETRGAPGEYADHCRIMARYRDEDGCEVHLVEGSGTNWEDALASAERYKLARTRKNLE
jgi:hypothetical protein